MPSLKDKVIEIAEIAKACPENLQLTCFELLLRDALEEKTRRAEKIAPTKPNVEVDATCKGEEQPAEAGSKTLAGTASNQDDIAESELHVKTKHFMKTRGVTIEQINNLFYKEGEAYMPLYEDFKTTRMAEAQVRIALMQGLKNALSSGDFVAQMQDIRAEANARKCYDASNWGRNFNTSAALFDFDKYDKSLSQVRLSEDGKRELAALIKELQ